MNAPQMTLTPALQQGLHKSSGGAKLLKADEDGGSGTARVAFAQLNVVDHDGDYTIPGAFQTGQKLKVCQTGHAHGMRVAGAGEILGEQEIDGAMWAVADLKFFLDTEAGREEYATVKALQKAGHSSEWSYGYDILDAAPGEVSGQRVQILKSLSVYEISPVLRGAGIGTHTLDVKSAPCPTCGATKAAPVVEEPPVDEPVVVVDEGDAEAKGRAEQAHLQWLEMKARQLTR